MQTINNTMETRAIFDESGKHRYLLEKTWDKKMPSAAILMLYPCSTDAVQMDLTTILTVNNLSKLGYGSVSIWNLFSKLNVSIGTDTEPNTPENDEQILQSAAHVDHIIIAFGKGNEGNKKVQKRVTEVLKLLVPFKEKVVTIEDPRGYLGFHPLTPSIRNHWKLVPFDFPVFEPEVEEKPLDKKSKKKSKKQVSVEAVAEENIVAENDVAAEDVQPDEETA